ncbi:arsenate reductase [Balneicella halophila]|uniref:Arsenate reductase n=1 Tax=Balneicella halophila TaxID=1537566 RepID=A0A7L4URG0_BALHA|nr:arsenate reductase (glutaredoxin) [Balneicella halophila]PVX52355.1 arsenate reductase [Balneicella halophila]
MDYTIYFNPRCSKCRVALQELEENKNGIKIIEYLKNPPTVEELKALLKKLGIKAEDLIRKTEAIYKEEFKGKELSEDEWIDAMVQHPKLIQRPIIVKGDKAVIGRTTESINSIK